MLSGKDIEINNKKKITILGSFQYRQAVTVSKHCDKCYEHQRNVCMYKGANTLSLLRVRRDKVRGKCMVSQLRFERYSKNLSAAKCCGECASSKDYTGQRCGTNDT